jgi:hypothetical protein
MDVRTKQEIYARAERYYNPEIVAVDQEAVLALEIPADQLVPLALSLPDNLSQTPTDGVALLIALNSINYKFWSLGAGAAGEPHVDHYEYAGERGSAGMSRAFMSFWTGLVRHAWPKFEPLAEADIVRYFGAIPDPEGRAENLNNVMGNGRPYMAAQKLVDKIFTACAVDADDADWLTRVFPVAYNDPYYARSQLALAMIASLMAGRGGHVDTSGLTVIAGYQAPRLLRAMGVLKYSARLQHRIDSLEAIPPGPGDEFAICSAVILAGRSMARHLGVTEAVVSNYLWQRRAQVGGTPFHLTSGKAY